jgi:hypothetical protein
MIYIGSRYENSEVQFILDGRQLTTRPTVSRGAVLPPSPAVVYRWADGDRPDILGKRFTDKAAHWWQVMDLNTEVIDPLAFRPGMGVVVR